MNKVLVTFYVPSIERRYEIFLPISKKIGNILNLLTKSINELSGGYYPLKESSLYNKKNGKKYDLNITIKNSDIRNGSEVIFI
jgi:hypothetical protein